MRNEELYASNFMEALLRAALLLSDRGQAAPREIQLLSRDECAPGRPLRTRCRIRMEDGDPHATEACVRIVFPDAPPHPGASDQSSPSLTTM